MPIPAPIQSPYGNGPSSLAPADPAQTMGSMQMGPASFRSPQGSPAPVPATSPGAGAAGGISKDEAAELAELQKMSPDEVSALKDLDSGEFSGPPQYFGSHLRQTPEGHWETDVQIDRRKGAKKQDGWTKIDPAVVDVFKPIVEGFQKAAGFLGKDAPRIMGGVLGGMAGGAAAGGPGEALGAGAGAAAAGYLGDKATAAMGGQPNPDPASAAIKDMVAGTAGAALGGQIGRSTEAAGAAAGAQATTDASAQAGGQALTEQANARMADADQTGVTLRRDEINPENQQLRGDVNQIAANGGQQAAALVNDTVARRSKLMQFKDGIVARLKAPLESAMQNQTGALGNKVTADSLTKPNFNTFFSDYSDAIQSNISDLKEQAFQAARQQTFEIPQTQATLRQIITKQLRSNIFNDNGTVNQRAYNDYRTRIGVPDDVRPLVAEAMRLEAITTRPAGAFKLGNYSTEVPGRPPGVNASYMPTSAGDSLAGPPSGMPEINMTDTSPQSHMTAADPLRSEFGANDAGIGTKGVQLRELDSMVKDYQDRANFRGNERSEVEKAWGQLSHQASGELMDSTAKVLDPVNKDGADTLKGLKMIFSQNKELLDKFQDQVKSDPTNAAASLIEGQDPKNVRQLLTLLDPDQQRYIAGGFLDHLTTTDDPGVRMNSSQVAKRWQSVDPKVKEMLFGDEAKKVDALINTSRVIDNRDITNYDAQSDKNTRDALNAIFALKGNLRGGFRFINSLFFKNLKARDYIVGKGAEVLMPPDTPAMSMERAAVLDRRARMIQSPVGKAAFQTGAQAGKEIFAPEPSPSPTMGDLQ